MESIRLKEEAKAQYSDWTENWKWNESAQPNQDLLSWQTVSVNTDEHRMQAKKESSLSTSATAILTRVFFFLVVCNNGEKYMQKQWTKYNRWQYARFSYTFDNRLGLKKKYLNYVRRSHNRLWVIWVCLQCKFVLFSLKFRTLFK